ncbi:MAG: hypothetical protein J7L55_03810 [Desulfurococcales archaeon]|nr:hypothetical protein [Desulfurococcales archaeon]
MKEFRSLYLDWYDLSLKTLEREVRGSVESFSEVEGLALVGMGGSGIACDVAEAILRERFGKPVNVVKGFRLPNWVRDGWGVIAVSYSGNTAETVSVVKEAVRRGCRFGVVTSGGKLMELAERSNAPYVLVDGGRVPRASFPALTLGLLKLMSELDLLEEGVDWLKESAEVLKKTREAERSSEELSDFLEGTIPVFIADEAHYPLALRAREEMNENAKTPSFIQVYPESAHNDIVSWEGWFGPLSAVILDTGNDIVRYIATYLNSVGVPTKIVDLRQYESYLGRTLRWAQVVGLASVRLALRRGVDPAATESIRKYKKFLKEYFRIE